jgi:hypothetical protein
LPQSSKYEVIAMCTLPITKTKYDLLELQKKSVEETDPDTLQAMDETEENIEAWKKATEK